MLKKVIKLKNMKKKYVDRVYLWSQARFMILFKQVYFLEYKNHKKIILSQVGQTLLPLLFWIDVQLCLLSIKFKTLDFKPDPHQVKQFGLNRLLILVSHWNANPNFSLLDRCRHKMVTMKSTVCFKNFSNRTRRCGCC